jgi:hypothetical protein
MPGKCSAENISQWQHCVACTGDTTWILLQCYHVCETWVLKESIIQKLSVLERKIFGPTKEKDGTWKIKTNLELDNIIQHRNIVNYVKSQRLSWLGQIHRMPETSIVRKIYKWQPPPTRPVGRQ